MITSTFVQLDEEKKTRIFNALIKEFRRVPYEEVSIKNIVEEASIPRGSFYAYFDNKEGALLYIISNVRSQIEKRIQIPDNLFEYVLSTVKFEIGNIKTPVDGITYDLDILKNISISPYARSILENQMYREFIKNPMSDVLFQKSGLGHLSEEELRGLIILIVQSTNACLTDILSGISSSEEAYKVLELKLRIIERGTRED